MNKRSKKTVKIISVVLAFVMVAVSLCSCSTNTRTVAKDESGNKISVAMYSLMTSLLKGDLAYYITYNYGSYNSSEFWNTVTDGETQMTYKDYYTYIIDEKVKVYLAALTLFDELGLSLTDAEIEAIDAELEEYIENDGDGSKNILNQILGEYGANYKTLREYKIMNAKIAKLETYLYGSNASQISDGAKQEFLEKNYVAFKQILFPTFSYEYEIDKFGDDIYFAVDKDGEYLVGEFQDGTKYYKISYDTVNGISVDSNNDGILDKDDNGETIYYKADSENLHIAYDVKNGKRMIVTDEKGNEVIKELTSAQKDAVKKEAEEVLSLVKKGETENFEGLILIYDDNQSVTDESERNEMYYLSTQKTYENFMTDGDILDSICAEVAKLEIGDYTLYKSDYGYHIVMRYEPEANAFKEEKNANWFEDSNGNYDFNSDIVNDFFMKKLQPYADKIVIDDDVKAAVDISKIAPNYNFY